MKIINDVGSEFKAEIKDKLFVVTITHESDLSLDGGYTFETVSNAQELDLKQAKNLIVDLEVYIKGLENESEV